MQSELKAAHPNLAYLHAIEPRLGATVGAVKAADASNDFIREIWSPKTLISAGGYKRDSAIKDAEEKDTYDLANCFISDYCIRWPDLPTRLMNNFPLNKYDRSTFYAPAEDPNAHIGYVGYPFYSPEGGGINVTQLK
ncbi:hypothetical protein BDQ17DRAFT_1544770 [Cyathus striatus]|nr:hypothetical protein BDQ17DRAFT_1544770 [Cyathus striatus]